MVFIAGPLPLDGELPLQWVVNFRKTGNSCLPLQHPWHGALYIVRALWLMEISKRPSCNCGGRHKDTSLVKWRC